MSEERARILQMISEGKIDAGQGVELLSALKTAKTPDVPEAGPGKVIVEAVSVPSGEIALLYTNVGGLVALFNHSDLAKSEECFTRF